jgi:hypothetical protein
MLTIAVPLVMGVSVCVNVDVVMDVDEGRAAIRPGDLRDYFTSRMLNQQA